MFAGNILEVGEKNEKTIEFRATYSKMKIVFRNSVLVMNIGIFLSIMIIVSN